MSGSRPTPEVITPRTDRPPDAVLLERSFSLVNEAMFTIALQARRLQSDEPEDDVFIFRRWADWQFMIVALRRLRRAAEVSRHVAGVSTAVSAALAEFDQTLPWLSVMRNVGEHIDDYVLNSERRSYGEARERTAMAKGRPSPPTLVHHGDVQVGSFDGSTLTWLQQRDGTPLRIEVADAQAAAEMLFLTIREATRSFPVVHEDWLGGDSRS